LFVFAEALLMNVKVTHQAWDNYRPASRIAGVLRRGRKQDLSGCLVIHPIPLPCS